MINKSIVQLLMLFSSVLSIPTIVLAQNNSSIGVSNVRVGIRAGGNSVLPLEKVEDATYYPTVSFHGGVFANIGRGRFTIQPEVNYSQRHVRIDYNQQGISLSAKVMTNRIEVPVLLKAMFGNSTSTVRFFVNGGPYGAYVLDERYKAKVLSYGGIPANFRALLDDRIAALNSEKATFNGSEGRISYGLAGGLGVAFRAGPGQLTIEGRALYELGDNTPANATDPTGTGLASNVRGTKYALLQASIGYLIPIGSR